MRRARGTRDRRGLSLNSSAYLISGTPLAMRIRLPPTSAPRRVHPEVMPVNRSALAVALTLPLLLTVAPPVRAGVLSLSIVSGITDLLGGTEIPDPVGQESLSGS